jgi:hypothetical protein
VQFKLAILTALATRADGRATVDELNSEVEALTADGDISSALDDVDIFQSGLVIPDGSWLQITAAGRSALKAIETSADLAPISPSYSKLIDDSIGVKERQKIFDLDLRGDEVATDSDGPESDNAASTQALPMAPLVHADAPAFLVRNGSRSGARAPGREITWRTRLSKLISIRLQQARATWRHHLEQDTANIKAGPRQTGNVSGAAIALLSLLVILICAGTVIALTQIRSLKTEVATLHRELSLLKERTARMVEEKTKQDANQQKEATNKSSVEKSGVGPDGRTDQATLNLTQEEVGLIRDFIKPAPVAGTPAPAINVGDTVDVATIPLPSQLMEKIPKLLGARFTTRNGSIIILKRDSRQADAVLPPS